MRITINSLDNYTLSAVEAMRYEIVFFGRSLLQHDYSIQLIYALISNNSNYARDFVRDTLKKSPEFNLDIIKKQKPKLYQQKEQAS